MIKGLSPLDEIDAVVRAVSVPVQAVGGLSIRAGHRVPARGAPLVVLGAPLVIDADGVQPAGTNLSACSRRSAAMCMRKTSTRSAHTSAPGTRSMTMKMPLSFSTRSSRCAVELREVAVPEIGDDDVLLAVGAVSVCGSDVHQAYNTHSWPVNMPVVLGHEFGGTVARRPAAP